MSGFKYGTIGDEQDPEMEFLQQPEPTIQTPQNQKGGNFVYSSLEEADSGPYFFLSPGEVAAVAELAMGFHRIDPASIAMIENVTPWVDMRYLENATGEKRESIDPESRRPDGFVEAKYTIHASANRSTLLQSFGPGGASELGLVEITAFSKMDPRKIGLAPFNRKISPVSIELGNVPDEYLKDVESSGALSVREHFVLEAREFFSSPEFVGQASVQLQRLYLQAIEEIMSAYAGYRRFANAYLDKQDHAIKLPDSNEKSKDTYDDRDKLMQWLVARQPIDTALTRALGQGGGLTAEQLKDVLASQRTTGDGGPATDGERAQCPNCGERIPLIAGELPPICRFCNTKTTDDGQPSAVAGRSPRTRKNK